MQDAVPIAHVILRMGDGIGEPIEFIYGVRNPWKTVASPKGTLKAPDGKWEF